jgi:hypothetical protein
VTRGLERCQPYAPELDGIAIVERRESVFGLRRCAQIDGRARPVAKLQVTGDEVRMQVREEDVRDAQVVIRGIGHVLINVALRIDDCRDPRLLIADDI